MGRSVDQLIAGLPKARRKKVEAKSRQLAREMSAGEPQPPFVSKLPDADMQSVPAALARDA